MLKGFKDFLLRGNVIDLSVAVVMGAAFGAIVTAFTDKLIRPMLNAITPPTSPGLSAELVPGKASTTIDFAGVITAALNFVVVAAVVYFVIVLPMKHIKERRKRGEEPGPAEPADVALLKEIRDLLSAQAGVPAGAVDGAVDGGADESGGAAAADEEEPELFTQPGVSTPDGPRHQAPVPPAGGHPATPGQSGPPASGPGGPGPSAGQRISRPFR
jgi:large conductance mechanosensitive channel